MKEICEIIGNGVSRHWKIDEILYEGNTKYQEIIIGKTSQGISLFCNNERQSTELSQLIYHEGQIVPGILSADKLNRVLIIGSSEGVTSQICLSAQAKEIIHVDIDQQCVELCAKYLPYGYDGKQLEIFTANKGNGIRVIYDDGFEYLKNEQKGIDLIVMDLPDERENSAEQHNRLYTDFFLSLCHEKLNENGVLITQAGSTTFWRNNTLISCFNRFNKVFNSVSFFEMEEQDWSFCIGKKTKKREDLPALMKKNLLAIKYRPKYIDELSIVKASILPKSIRDGMKNE